MVRRCDYAIFKYFIVEFLFVFSGNSVGNLSCISVSSLLFHPVSWLLCMLAFRFGCLFQICMLYVFLCFYSIVINAFRISIPLYFVKCLRAIPLCHFRYVTSCFAPLRYTFVALRCLSSCLVTLTLLFVTFTLLFVRFHLFRIHMH